MASTWAHLLLAAVVLCAASCPAHALISLTQVGLVPAQVGQQLSYYLDLSGSATTYLATAQGVYVQVTSPGAQGFTSGCTNSLSCLSGTSNATIVMSISTQPLGSGVDPTTFTVCALVTDLNGLNTLAASSPAQLPIPCSDSALTITNAQPSAVPTLSGSINILAPVDVGTYPKLGVIPSGSTAAYPASDLYFVVFNAGVLAIVKPKFQLTNLRIQVTTTSTTGSNSPVQSPASPGHAAATRPSHMLSALALLVALVLL